MKGDSGKMKVDIEYLENALDGDDPDVIDGLLSALDSIEAYEAALQGLEAATTNFILSVLKYMTVLPKDEFEPLLSALTCARRLMYDEPT